MSRIHFKQSLWSKAIFVISIFFVLVASANLEKNSRVLLKEFVRAQNTELKALEHRQKFDIKELKASQVAKKKEWEKKEKEARHKFFEEHPKGPERRAYVQDYIKRREAFLKQLSEEKTQRTKNLETELAQLRADQKSKLEEFKKASEKGEKPASSLWPKPGR